MTLFQFLNLIRKEGVDITRIHVRMARTTGTWGRGLQLSSLRGNRLGVKTAGDDDYKLHPGHQALRGEVISVHRYSESIMNKLVSHERAPAIVVEITRVSPA